MTKRSERQTTLAHVVSDAAHVMSDAAHVVSDATHVVSDAAHVVSDAAHVMSDAAHVIRSAVHMRASAEFAAVTLCTEGATFTERGDSRNAIACYKRAVMSAPHWLDVHLILANAQQLDGDELAARATLRHALTVTTRADAATEFALGSALVNAGAGADAVSCFRRVKKLRPRDAVASGALAAALRDAGSLSEAWNEITHALSLSPRDATSLLTAARIRHDQAEYRDAMRWCERSLAVRPNAQNALMTRGYLHHLLGDTRRGWEDFEARTMPVPNGLARRWRGESLIGKSLLVIGEQGVGDQLQFLRFVHHELVQQATRVTVACHPAAQSLLEANGYHSIVRNAPCNSDYYVPLQSLPSVLNVDAGWAEHPQPYLRARRVADALPGGARRVGLVWAGNQSHRNDAVRSMPSALLHPLIERHSGIEFVSLQLGAGADALPARVTQCSTSDSWLTTAQQLDTLDLLISVDTGIAHLAGAMGVPVWTMLSHVPDWRWGASSSLTPWYPSMRLFRQTTRGDWPSVVGAVSVALAELSAAPGRL